MFFPAREIFISKCSILDAIKAPSGIRSKQKLYFFISWKGRRCLPDHLFCGHGKGVLVAPALRSIVNVGSAGPPSAVLLAFVLGIKQGRGAPSEGPGRGFWSLLG